ncbi:MAG: type 4a pilus biogenesis protein PilO [Parcubacteria group bacterium]|nr:type 4a pilus biogenesis protein PilO [Parcubacteria group bacterium]
MNKRLITNTVVYAALVLAVWFVAMPVWSSFRVETKEIALKKQTIALEKQVIAKLNSVSQVLNSQKDNVSRLEQAIPGDELKPELLSIMENLASQNGLALLTIGVKTPTSEDNARAAPRTGEVKSAGSIKTLEVDLQVSGTYSSFKNWLEAIEKNLRITDVSGISFAIEEKKNAEGEVISAIDPVIDYTVSMNTYVLKK